MAVKIGPNDLISGEHFLVLKKEGKKTNKGDLYYQLQLSNKDGIIEAKIWNNNIPQCNLDVGKIIEANGKTQEYNGKLGLIVDSCQIVNNEEIADYSPITKTMVFDIETVGKKFEELDETEQDYLLNNLERNTEDKEEAKKKTGLYSIFGKVCAIGAFNPGSEKGVVLLLGEKELTPEKENYTYKIFETEKDLLIEFWKMAEKYELFVSYN